MCESCFFAINLACLRNVKFRNNQQEHFLSALYSRAPYPWMYYSCNFKSALEADVSTSFFGQQLQRHSELGETSCSLIIILII